MLTTKDIKEIRECYANTFLSQKEKAKMYNVDRTTISRYVRDIKRERHRNFYKGKFLIALYDEKEILYNVFDNVYEMAKYLQRTENSLSRNKRLRHKYKWFNIKLIEV